jgi:hypothetical protein
MKCAHWRVLPQLRALLIRGFTTWAGCTRSRTTDHIVDGKSRPAWTRAAELLATMAVFSLALAGCGGGAGGGDGSGGSSTALQGLVTASTVSARINSTNYLLNVYLPPTTAGRRSDLPTMYVLDGETWFLPLVNIVEATHAGIIIIAINTMDARPGLRPRSENGDGSDTSDCNNGRFEAAAPPRPTLRSGSPAARRCGATRTASPVTLDRNPLG